VSGIDHDDIDAGFNQRGDAILGVAADTDRGRAQ